MNKKIIALLTATIFLVMLQTAARAEFSAEQFAQSFNTFQFGTNTYVPNFIVRGNGPNVNVIDVSARGFSLNVDAYSPSSPRLAGMVDPSRPGEDVGQFNAMEPAGYVPGGKYYGDDIYFSSFALNWDGLESYQYNGKLDYDNGATRTSAGTAINLGVVYLYTQYSTGKLYGYDYANNSNAAELNEAFQFLMGNGNGVTTWTNNRFLEHLVTETGGPGVWTTPYNLNTVYPAWVDNNYAVYVINLSQIDYERLPELYPTIPYMPVGDMLYLVRRDGGDIDDPNPVPEPATLIIWSVIGVGLLGTTRRKKRT